MGVAAQDGVGRHRLGDEVLGRTHAPAVVDAHERGVDGARRHGVDALEHPLDELELVDAGVAEALHAEQAHLQTRRLVREARADVAAAVAVGDGHLVAAPIACERLDAVGRHAALLGSPGRRLGNAVLMAEHVVLKPVEALHVGGHVLLVVEPLGHPHVGDGQLQGRVGVGQHGDPLVGVRGVGVVDVGRDVDGLDADLVEPVAQAARLQATPAPGRGLGIGAPEQDGVAVLAHIPDDVVLRVLLSVGLHAPDVLGAPVPALPAVRLAGLDEVVARLVPHVVEHERRAAMGARDHLGLTVALALDEDGAAAVLTADALDLGGDEVGGLVPADALVAAHAAVLRVALALRVPVHALERVRDAIGRVGTLLVGQRKRRKQRLHAGAEGVAPHLVTPFVQLLGGVVLVIVQRADAHHLAV